LTNIGCRIFLFVTWGTYLVLLTSSGAGAKQAPQFSCGPNALTYLAIDRADDPNTGPPMGVQVRCSIVNATAPASHSPPIPKLVWYGEGWDFVAANRNQHLGFALATKGTSTLEGWAADIAGNRRETFEGTISLDLVHGSWPVPTGVDAVSSDGQFHERWTLVTSIPYSPLPRPSQCVPQIDSEFYKVFSASYAGHSGSGLRCVASLGNSITAWFGNGTMDGARYTEIGYRTSTGFAVADLCAAAFGTRCWTFSTKSLAVSIKRGPGSKRTRLIRATFKSADTTWSERWVQK
jgi:hypothetical protein